VFVERMELEALKVIEAAIPNVKLFSLGKKSY
jgi:hypothetical protein